MRVFIIDAGNMGAELQGGLIGVLGSAHPSAEEKRECVDIVSRYAMDGWAISSDPFTPIGWLAAITVETACVPFVSEACLRFHLDSKLRALAAASWSRHVPAMINSLERFGG